LSTSPLGWPRVAHAIPQPDRRIARRREWQFGRLAGLDSFVTREAFSTHGFNTAHGMFRATVGLACRPETICVHTKLDI
jgi:hypothetical protein